MAVDRLSFVPAHQGPHILPNHPLFSTLLRHARRNRTAIRDVQLNVSKTYGEILDAVLSFRDVVRAALPKNVNQRLRNGEEVYIGVIAAGGYEFTVAILAVLAMGAAVVPIFPKAPPEELRYFAAKSQQVAILSGVASARLANEVAQTLNIPHIEILVNIPPTRLTPLDMSISSDKPLDNSSPGVVIFTSGTTGRPKGVVLRRMYIHETALAIAEGYDLDHNDVLLHVLPVHHTTGLGTSFFPFLCVGACIEFHAGFDAEKVWNRWLEGGVTVFSAVPTIYMRLKGYFEKLPAERRMPFIQAAQQFRAFLCGSSALQDNIQEFWTAIRGQSILTRYGASEFPGCLKVPSNHGEIPSGSVGLPVPGVELKISAQGELLVKSPHMFAKYLGDEEATRRSHDKEGWFRTGDIARKQGPYYFIIGRASVDIIKSGGYKISAIDVERECLSLPYVEEAMVVGVDDEEYGQRVGAVVVVKGSTRLTLDELRTDLRSKLAGYKLPTVLRVVEDELPKGPTGKVQKKILGPQLIPSPGYDMIPEVQVWRRQVDPGRLQARL